MQFGSIGADCIACQFAPKTTQESADNGKGARQQRNRGARQRQDRSTHDATPTPTARANLTRFVPWSSRPTARFMDSDDGVTAVKNGYRNGTAAAFLQSAFPEVYCCCVRAGRRPRACSFEFPPLHQPRISRKSVRQRVSVGGRIRAAIARVFTAP